MGTNKFSHTHRLTVWFEEISFKGFSWKIEKWRQRTAVAAETMAAAAETISPLVTQGDLISLD